MNKPTCTCPSGDGSLDWPCPVHPVDPGSMEGAFHRAIKPFVDKTLQGRIMGAFRKVMQDRAARLAAAEVQITNPWKDAIINAWCANGVRAMHEDPQKAVAELLAEVSHMALEPDETCRFCGIKTDSPCDAPPADICEQAINATYKKYCAA